ncbi:hypothetical protein BC749_1011064 [Flavobacterium araucananum]|uniref:Uncharacterized protein n=1 Tax=Flavobacterium araucananum TaxID=946678 RepID=A0A227PJX4_9FLAO|nr:hypothetical protein [Flavobacterium araucananum]OXG09578.1 hypothetical protein B0A64_02155 [Flavobacterium araucananum]PWK02979.1 hypothetical protein BC749_1011064 [Flavobacterium araucananum]
MKNKYIIILSTVILGLIAVVFYFKDEKVYTSKEYSSDVKQKKEVFESVIKNEGIEEKIENFPSGKIMRYTSYDDLGIQAFTVLFDEKGNVENFKGYPLIETYQNQISRKRRLKQDVKQYLKVGDTLKYHYLIANVPNAKRNFKIENTDVDDTKVKRIVKKTSKIGIDVKEVLTKKGINTIEAVLNYEFNDKEKTSITYTEIFEVEVH